MAYKLDIMEVLDHLDRRDFSFFNGLADDKKKAFPGIVAMRFMSTLGDGDEAAINLFLTNTIANTNFYDLYEHPELQYKLLASCGTGRKRRHPWIPMAGSVAKQTELHDFLQSLHPSANDFELGLLFRDLTRAELLGLIQDCGLPPDRSKTLLNAFDKKSKKDSPGKSQA